MKINCFYLFIILLFDFNAISAQVSVSEELELIGAVDMASTKLERVKYSDKERDDYLLSFISINISYGSNVAVSSTNMSIDFKANEKEFNEFYLTLESVMKTRKSKTIKLINHTLNVSKM